MIGIPKTVAARVKSLGLTAVEYTPSLVVVACPGCGGQRDVAAATLFNWAKAGKAGRCRGRCLRPRVKVVPS
jgi:hypothetical protein